jgi:hypothetical protein
MNHVGQDWTRKHLAFVLEARLMADKGFRDNFVTNLSDIVVGLRGPVAKTMPSTPVLQRKMACWRYNQHGLWEKPLYKLPHNDPNYAQNGYAGTREWVPWLNIHQWTMTTQIKTGHVFAHRVHIRGYGTCPHLTKGKWKHRWNKCFERDHMNLTRS